MIRNVVVGRLRDSADARDRTQLEDALAGIAGLRLPGMIANRVGLDIGVRESSWSFAITNDWADIEAYRNYDQDVEHNGYRALVGKVCAEIARVQFEVQ